MERPNKQYVLVIPDGAADSYRDNGRSPLALADTSYMDQIADEGICGLVHTLYGDLPKESIVAQLGMLCWDPHLYYPGGRASCELLALEGVQLNEGDIAFRANLVRMESNVLASYNADYIYSAEARLLVNRVNDTLRKDFPAFELYHNSDFRNTLVVRDAQIDPRDLICPEPHESHGVEFDVARLLAGRDEKSHGLAARINSYLQRVAEVLAGEAGNMIFPWSASTYLNLPPFAEVSGFSGRTAIVGCVDFLHGIAKAGGIDSYKVGNGRPDTDYAGKGAKVVELLRNGYEFVVCHINAPDEAAHMRDLAGKIRSLEMIDKFIVSRIVNYFRFHQEQLGGVMIVPDHYTNLRERGSAQRRADIHSIHPVPFALWNGRERDSVRAFSEDAAVAGKYASPPVNHLDLTTILGVSQTRMSVRRLKRMNTASA
jgi:2,3-bisphosphoglycerate-independent phosphoglycerate mutase